jgi:hypothetical protein
VERGALACELGARDGNPRRCAARAVTAEDVENVLGAGLDVVASVRGDRDGDKLQRFARAWDSGTLTLADMTPQKGRLGSEKLETLTSLSRRSVGSS